MDRPETRFTFNGDAALAYQILGDGPADLLYLQGFMSNLELNWDHPAMARFLHGLARSRRLIVTDYRGLGCSERGTPHEVPALESMMDDLIAVLEVAGSERAVILATRECCFVACLFAATYPDRTAGLVLYEAAANWLWSEETPWEWTEDRFEEDHEWFRNRWGTRAGAIEYVDAFAPTMAGDPNYIDWSLRYMLLSLAPGAAVATSRKYMYTDIRPILPSIHVPVLILERPLLHEEYGASTRYVADHIPGASLVELPGADSPLWLGDQASVLQAVDAFHGELRREERELERVLTTVLFTDIVGSTEKAADLGDRAWRGLVARHHATVRAFLERYRGTEVDTAGDGFFATFDGPARAVRCAQAIGDAVRSLGIEIRSGCHTGEIELEGDGVRGIAVHIGARVAALAEPSRILVSSTVKDLVAGSGLAFEDAGEHELKGVPDRWHLYRAVK